MSDFDSILDRAGAEVSDEVVLYPSGTYQLKCAGVSEKSFTNDEGRDVETVSFGFAVGQPGEDVDTDELSQVADQVQGQRVWKRFTLDNSSNVVQFKRAIAAMGIDPNEPGTKLRDQAKKCRGQEVLGYIGRKSFTKKDGTTVVDNEVKTLAAAA